MAHINQIEHRHIAFFNYSFVKKGILFFIVLLFSTICFSQKDIKQLEKQLKASKSDAEKVELLIKLSTAYRNCDLPKALKVATAAIPISKRCPKIYQAKALNIYASCLLDKRAYEQAGAPIEAAITICHEEKDYTSLVVALNAKARYHIQKSEHPQAIDCYNKALEIAQSKDDKNGMSLSHLNLGLEYATISNNSKSFEHLKKSIEIDSLLGNKDAVAKGYGNLGLLYNQMGDYNNSFKYYTKAYNLSSAVNNRRDMGTHLSNIGNVYFQSKDYPKALSYYFKSISMKQQVADMEGVANTYNNIGAVYVGLKKIDSTVYYFKKALKIYERLGAEAAIARSYANLGSAYRMLGDDKNALSYINRSIVMKGKNGDVKGVAASYFNLGEYYSGKNDDLALKYYKKAQTLAKKINDNQQSLNCFKRISAIYERKGLSTPALSYLKKYNSISDSLYGKDKQSQLLELQTKYEVVEKDNKIKELAAKNKIDHLEVEKRELILKRQRLIIGIVISFLTLVSCFSILYFLLFKQKQAVNIKLAKQNVDIEQQNKEILSQRDKMEALNKELEVQKEKVTNQRDSIEAELRSTLLAAEILKRKNIQFKFEVLKNQISPHFLFNTLSTLIYLIPENAVLAEQYTRHLSSVYLYILTSRDKELVRLSEEIDFINSYIYLISIRFDDNVKVDIDIEKEKLEYHLPLLSLQLLVENAIKHNTISSRKPLFISIKNDGDSIVIQNNLQKKLTLVSSTKIGLKNIISRYVLVTDEKVEVVQSDKHFTVKLPLIKEGNM